eukprot:765694-Hanusia_phi.AAC.4
MKFTKDEMLQAARNLIKKEDQVKDVLQNAIKSTKLMATKVFLLRFPLSSPLSFNSSFLNNLSFILTLHSVQKNGSPQRIKTFLVSSESKGFLHLDLWRRSRVVVCTAASAVNVGSRLMRVRCEMHRAKKTVRKTRVAGDVNGRERGQRVGSRGGARGGMEDLEGVMEDEQEEEEDLPPLDFVILDEAAAMLEPDSLGCLLHGLPFALPLFPAPLPPCSHPLAYSTFLCSSPPACFLPLTTASHSPRARVLLLVGDHLQLQPFSKWKEGAQQGYRRSLMERLTEEEATFPSFMLDVQYRMHPSIAEPVSREFYRGRIKTDTQTAVRGREDGGGRERKERRRGGEERNREAGN